MTPDEIFDSIKNDYETIEVDSSIKRLRMDNYHKIISNAKINFKRLSSITGYYPPKAMSPYCHVDDYINMFNYLKTNNIDFSILNKVLVVSNNSHKQNNGKNGNSIEQALTNEANNKDSDRDTFVAEIKAQTITISNKFTNNLIIGSISHNDLFSINFVKTHIFKSKIESLLLITILDNKLDEMYHLDKDFWTTFETQFEYEWNTIVTLLRPAISIGKGITEKLSYKGSLLSVRTTQQKSLYYPKLHINKDIFKHQRFKTVKKASDTPKIVYMPNTLYSYTIPEDIIPFNLF